MKKIKHAYFPLTLTFLMLITAWLPINVEDLLIFDRQRIVNGEWWRILSAHLIHLSWQHLLMNITGLWIIYWLAKNKTSTTEWFISLVLCSLLIGLALLYISDIHWYVGLSGTLHSFLILVAYQAITQSEREGWLILLFVIAKVGWEQWQGASPSLEHIIGGNIVIDAHFFGVISGLILASTHHLFVHSRWNNNP